MKHLLLYALFVYIGIGCCRDTALAPYTLNRFIKWKK